ncbi:MAG: glycosyltransferase [Candidatus Omnitrophica bacterium]|nr:glycosyltransferase [Candidatus Omnitrophota bacterium]
MNKDVKLGFIVPTKGRYDLLSRLIESISKQDIKPDLLIVVDANTKESPGSINDRGLQLKYVYTGPNSLTEARNIGIKHIPDDFELVGYLDDDVILCEKAVEQMLKFWVNSSEKIAGAAFNIINERKSRRLWFLKILFLTGDKQPGNILPSGYQTLLDNLDKDTFTKWLPGGVTIWRKRIFNDFSFDEAIKNYGYIEDLDFSYRVSKDYKLIALKEPKLIHNPHPVKSSDSVGFGISEILNRFYFINKHKEFSKILFYWASFGKFLENMAYGIFLPNSDYFKRSLGNLKGLKIILAGTNFARR